MINMIKADIYRIFRGKGIYIALFIMLAMIAMSIYNVSPGAVGQMEVGDVSTAQYSGGAEVLGNMTYEQMQDMSMKEYREAMLKVKGYELDKDILAANMNLYYIFIFIVALIITVDFSGGCVKNTLSSAISRKRYFLSKSVLIFGLGTLVFFLNTYLVYFSNIIFNSKNLSSSLWEVTKVTLIQLPPAFALMSLLMGIAFLTKKTAVYNMITIPFIMVFQLLFAFAVGTLGLDKKYINYELQIMFGKLAADPSKSYMINSYLVCVVIIIAFVLLGWLAFRKTEIK